MAPARYLLEARANPDISNDRGHRPVTPAEPSCDLHLAIDVRYRVIYRVVSDYIGLYGDYVGVIWRL